MLGKKTILKSDHFPGCQNRRLQPQVEGAPNYRQVGALPIYGVAIPTIDGIRQVLELVGASKNSSKQAVLWHSLREEPVVYINGRPYVLREVERPFTNLEYTGINRERVEEMEDRLKQDILQEAARFTNKVLVNDELPDGQMVDQWEPVSSDSVQTPLEVYEALESEGYLVDYHRVPITDEKSPKERDFDLLVQHLLQVDIGTAAIFNCQMGRGRTTTGMVVATLVHLKRTGVSGMTRSSSLGLVLQSGELCNDVPDSEEAIRRGEYTVIRSLIRVLEGGVEGKRQVDRAIDKCSAMQNLREAIAGYRNNIQRQADEKKREAALSFFAEYLERYYFLICFAVYIHTDQSDLFALEAPSQGSFQNWMKARPELYSILRRLLRRDPMAALSYNYNSSGFIKKNFVLESGRPSDTEAVVAMRNGEVLGRETVLKSDHCPGCQNLSLSERVEGAPNFREVLGYPVYGVANPTKDGILAVLQRVGGGRNGRPVLWHNMREEPVVYINGNPFVLREVKRPFKNMLEYTGIDRERVEKMESRLKEDVLREAERYKGAIMVNHETEDGQIFDVWEQITAESVQTPFEVFKDLESNWFPVEYARVPITDGKAPRSSDFGTIAARIASAAAKTAFVFNCQMGRGRTTTGTVIACLVKLRCDFGRPLTLQAYPRETSDGDSDSSSGDEAGTEIGSGINLTGSTTIDRQNSLSGFVMDDIPLIRRITRLLENGAESRAILDGVVDRCAMMQNLRQAILQYKKVFNNQNLEHHKRRAALKRGAEYLERYFMLIAFVAYLGSDAFDGFCTPGCVGTTFKSWLYKTPEIQQMKWSIRIRPAQVFAIPEVEFRTYGDAKEGDPFMEAVVKARSGSVLVKRSILKMYSFPGQKTTSGYVNVDGAPPVCKVEEVPVYSSATPTVNGAKAILAQLDAEPGKEASSMCSVIVIDLREEVVVYICGNPFVLRELEQPVHTLKHVGTSGPAVAQMEKRLKEDILSELAMSSGRILLHREEWNPVSSKSDIIGYWEAVTSDDVWTPSEVYANLKKEGYCIDYERIPLTKEREAVAADVDAIQIRTQRDDRNVKHLYISHTGYGEVAYAMAISCLLLQARVEMAQRVASTSKEKAIDYQMLPAAAQILRRPFDDDEAYRQGDYRDVLSLTRVLANGPASKIEVDKVIERCQVAGNLCRDVLYYKQQLQCCDSATEEFYYHLDMGIKALRRYCFLIAFRSYLYSCVALHSSSSAGEKLFSEWMRARPELAHICNNLKLE